MLTEAAQFIGKTLLYGGGIGIGLTLLIFGPSSFRALQSMYGGRFPFDYPRWYYRWRRRRQLRPVKAVPNSTYSPIKWAFIAGLGGLLLLGIAYGLSLYAQLRGGNH
jgi:hypothetical protein